MVDGVHDVVIVGGRCAGAALGMLLARAGADVVVVDQVEPTTDTLSTHALMRGALVLLERWGLLDPIVASGLPAATQTVFHYEGRTEAIPMASLYAPRRTVLDPILAEAARQSGVDFRYGIHVEDVLRDHEGRVSGVSGRDAAREPVSISARMTVGADGKNSVVARQVGAEAYRTGGPGAFMTYGYYTGLDVEGFHWLYAGQAGGGLIPTNDGRVLVSASTRPDRRAGDLKGRPDHGLHDLLREVEPDVAEQVAGAETDERIRAYPGVAGYFRPTGGPGWTLVGDAGHMKDPNTAHGITDALRDAALGAPAILAVLGGADEAVAMAGFQDDRDQMAVPIFEATETICSYSWTMQELQQAHVDLARAMRDETKRLAGLPD